MQYPVPLGLVIVTALFAWAYWAASHYEFTHARLVNAKALIFDCVIIVGFLVVAARFIVEELAKLISLH